MIDFVEYVVGELKSKRLTKSDAVALVRQFAERAGAGARTELHPLVHQNTSTLGEQRFTSVFSGGEFFLAHHELASPDGALQRVLPGVAYLEMARAAAERALADGDRGRVAELIGTVWVAPLVVDAPAAVGIALSIGKDDEVEFEVFSERDGDELLHCRGTLAIGPTPAPTRIDLDPIRQRLGRGRASGDEIYAAFTRLGLVYGEAFRALAQVDRGAGEALAELRLPAAVAGTLEAYGLHPSIMDGALQAALGAVDADAEAAQAYVPFAVERVRIAAPCGPDMLAWVRVAKSPGEEGQVLRLDVDLCDPQGQVCVEMRGVSARPLHRRASAAPRPHSAEAAPAPPADTDDLAERTRAHLKQQLAALLKVPEQEIDVRAELEAYGIDSMLAMKMTNQLEKSFGSLPKTLFFEYRTLEELSGYFRSEHGEKLRVLLGVGGVEAVARAKEEPREEARRTRRGSRGRFRPASWGGARSKGLVEPIAVVGLSGRYPEAYDLEEFWKNLREGKDCIVEVPRERWDWREYYSEDRTRVGSHYSKWGGFISGVDEFDPLFFSISPAEAEQMDPQERLFLEHVWMSIEDAGYTRAGLQGRAGDDLAEGVGVYVGVMYSEYQLFGVEASVRGKRMGVPGSLASIANRVSYVLNLRGPSMTLDTMCSSSLTAIHLACQDLREGRTWMALAGGVNVSIHPSKYLVLSAGQFISSDGHCQSFGEGGGGYIPGEGVGVVVLKRVSDAKRDGDHIYGLIRGSALTHGGKTNGYTVPNPQEQTGVIRRALKEAGADAREVSYIEAHGTGTKLGDPIEISALSKAFREYTEESGYCLLGSVKSNIGHCESAAGIAGLTKVLLQMKHGEVVPSLHSKQLNPHIDFEKSPFVVNQELCEWKRPVIEGRERRRLAGVSSFGAGGSNAHVLVEEAEQEEVGRVVSERVVLLLSARTKEQLREKARGLLEYVSSRAEEIDLRRMAYTLQVGREAMEERAALVVETVGEVLEKLGRYVGGERGLEGVYEGQVKRGGDAVLLFSADADLRETVEKWLSSRRLTKLAELWTKGLEVEWTKLYGEEKPRRMSLPAYRFARERYWVDVKVGEASGRGLESVLHPLLHRNVSDLSEQRYETTFSGEEYFLLDHRVGVGEGSGEKVLPGVAYLEMARKALELGVGRGECGAGEVLELRNVVWAEPVRVEGSKRVSVSLSGTEGEEVECEVYSEGEGGEEEHFQGRGLFVRGGEREALDVEDLKGRMSRGRMSGDELYEKYRGLGLKYGPTMRVLREVYRGRGEALAWLKVPEGVSGTLGEYVLHPSVLDGALQSALGLLEGEEEVGLRVPYALERLSVWGSCAGEMWSWVRYVGGGDGSGKVVKVDIDVCDASGRVCAELRGLSTREVKRVEGRASSKESGRVMAVPVWRSKGVGAGVVEEGRVYGERQLVLCELPWLSGAGVESLGRRAQVTVLSGGEGKNVAARYGEHALSCFELLKGVLERKRRGKALVQVVVGSEGVGVVYGGLWGLLKTVELENPQVVCQLIEVSGELSAEELSKRVEEEEKESGLEPVRYERGLRQVMSWEEVRGGDVRLSWREDGVYLITGGAGGLGLIFARDMLERTREGRVVLTGRSAGEEMGSRLSALEEWGGRVTYRRMELGDAEQVRGVIEGVLREHGKLNGIVHSAGMVSDAFVLKKGREEFLEVLGPKVMGTYNLDEASAGVGLDFFVMFSSMSGVFGNVGQSDYASANGFMDGYARYRNGEVREGRRSGRTVSIEWPLWESGGMGVASGRAEMLELATGMRPMRTGSGVESFHVGLSMGHERLLVAEGDVGRMREVLLGGGRREDAGAGEVAASAEGLPAGEDIEQRTQEYLKRQLSGPLKLSPQRIDARAELEAYGIDSVLAMKMTSQLEKSFGSLPKTLFFEYRTIASLAEYFVRSHRDALLEQLGAIKPRGPETRADALASNQGAMPVARRRKARFVERGPARQAALDVAVVGLAGRYPGARTVREFWANLREGRDCITEIPRERWNLEDYYDADPARRGTAYSKWGGFIADVDKFDPLFFNISPKEAQLIDPQERLFLETAWEVVEDAGYGREALAGRNVGVYVGVMWGHYELFGAEAMLRGQPGIPGSSYASIANRVSYFFDLHGPSIALDTMCSSSLTAVHLACEALRRGEVEAAIAGGVNVTIHPLKFLSLSQGRFVSTDGRCRSFGEGGDGYVPGEGVGAVLLKPLHAALRDGDHVYGIIKSTALNHGGKTNGYTVPNPGAQADVVRGALRSAGADPRTVSYVEAHGTGTSLGDPIEIAALAQAFDSPAAEKQFCAIGSVKSNIGHLESAAGIAALTKVLLQLRHGQIAPSLHATPANPNIDFESTPFHVQRELGEWPRGEQPRRAGISSFGAGGSNAHLVVEEYPAPRAPEPLATPVGVPEVFLASAKDDAALRRYVEAVVDALSPARDEVALGDVAYTTQVGRTAMEVRLAVVASTLDDLLARLRGWLALPPRLEQGGETDQEHVYACNTKQLGYRAAALISGSAGAAYVEGLLAAREVEKAAQLWALGVEVDWARLPRDGRRQRLSLPTYPFARERCWVHAQGPLHLGRAPGDGRAVDAAAPGRARAQGAPDGDRDDRATSLVYRSAWVEAPLPPRIDLRAPADQRLLVLGADEALRRALAERAASPAPHVAWVTWGAAFERHGADTYTLNPAQEADFAALADDLAQAGAEPDAVVHLCVDPGGRAEEAGLDERLTQGLYALFHLAQAMARRSMQRPVRVLSVSADTDGPRASLGAGLAGFLKSLALEAPRYSVRSIAIEAGSDSAALTSCSAQAVWSELLDDAWARAQEVRYRAAGGPAADGWTRQVREWLPVPMDNGNGAMPLREGGVYVVTGGAGGLGRIFSEYLTRHARARLLLVGRSELTAEQVAWIRALERDGAQAHYLRADVSRQEGALAAVAEAKQRYGTVHGVVHAAGVTRDAFMLRKTRSEIEEVLAAKVYGTVHLDAATQDDDLDCFVAFSSLAGVVGNVGQCDYAFANRFVDAFVEWRASLAELGQRRGRSLAVSWPLWEQGGMRPSAQDTAAIERRTGLRPLPTPDGLRCFETLLRSQAPHGVVLYGDARRLAASLVQTHAEPRATAPEGRSTLDATALLTRTVAYLKGLLAAEIKLAPERIEAGTRFESYGVDSVMITSLNNQLEKDLGPQSKTLFYEHETIAELARALLERQQDALALLLGAAPDEDARTALEQAGHAQQPSDVGAPMESPSGARVVVERPREDRGPEGSTDAGVEPIAIVGMHGHYPRSRDLDAYWDNLKAGRSLTGLVPADRWDCEALYDPDPAAVADGKIYCKWGGFLEDHDKFDAAFFNIPAAEAHLLDPQERVVLESVWAALEDAGYTREELKARYPKGKSADVGVFVGVTTNSYQLWGPEESHRGRSVSPSAMPWSIANRVSYFFDFGGPSLPVDTACSSSLVALHLACESLRRGECRVAIAGGVNLYLHPAKYQSMCQRNMLSLGDKTHSFGAGDDGFVPGEGVGSLVLKPLRQALQDGDIVHAVVRGSAFEHAGRSNGYSAPNPNSQARVIRAALAAAGAHPESISYVEGHGTGTQMGDSLEIAALTQAFSAQTSKTGFCPIGSVKANAGHSESAAGVAAVAKVVLQLRHRQLAPSIHADVPNPDIDFARSPFYLQRELGGWDTGGGAPRRALVNSFGAGGANACVVLEEHDGGVRPALEGDGQPHVFTLSAKSDERLREYGARFLAYLDARPSSDVRDICHTLQVGREAMSERLAIVASDLAELTARLRAWIGGAAGDGVFAGSVTRGAADRRPRQEAADGHASAATALAAAWVRGEALDWRSTHAGVAPRRISLPVYPFARDRYWVTDAPAQAAPEAPPSHQVHPLISYNCSTLKEVRFASWLPDTAFYAVDHGVNEERILPGVAFVEMACVAGNLAGDRQVRRIEDVVWIQPVSFNNGPQVLQIALSDAGPAVAFKVSSFDDDNEELIHSEGRLTFADTAPGEPELVPIERLKAQCAAVRDGRSYYAELERHGFHYGPTFRTIQEIHVGESFVLARLELAEELRSEFDQFILHPSIMDGALQTAGGLARAGEPAGAHVPFSVEAIEILRPLPQVCYALAEHAQGSGARPAARKFDIRLLSARGEVLVRLTSLFMRPLAVPELLAAPGREARQ